MEGTKMEIRIATEQEIKTLDRERKHGRRKSPIRIRIEALEDETVAFDDCCDGGMVDNCPIIKVVKNAIVNIQTASPEDKFQYRHIGGCLYVWRRKEKTDG